MLGLSLNPFLLPIVIFCEKSNGSVIILGQFQGLKENKWFMHSSLPDRRDVYIH